MAIFVLVSVLYWTALPVLALALTVGFAPGACFDAACDQHRLNEWDHFRWSMLFIGGCYLPLVITMIRSTLRPDSVLPESM